jgi:hypothetical protein
MKSKKDGIATISPDISNGTIAFSFTILYKISGIHPTGEVHLIMKESTVTNVIIA